MRSLLHSYRTFFIYRKQKSLTKLPLCGRFNFMLPQTNASCLPTSSLLVYRTQFAIQIFYRFEYICRFFDEFNLYYSIASHCIPLTTSACILFELHTSKLFRFFGLFLSFSISRFRSFNSLQFALSKLCEHMHLPLSKASLLLSTHRRNPGKFVLFVFSVQ